MQQGTVKFWREDKGYGFVANDDGSGDVFVHISKLVNGRDGLHQDDRVSFDVGINPKNGKTEALNVRVV